MGPIKVAILGAGAMGSLFGGGFLSQHNRVWLIDVDQNKVDAINREGGVTILSGGERLNFQPQALRDTRELGAVDLILVFVKAMHSESALAANKHLIGENTCIMTLQNGAGHEDLLSRFVPWERLILGTTEHNGSVTEDGGEIHHGGGGPTHIGLVGAENEVLQTIAEAFTKCGIQTGVADNIKEKKSGVNYL